MSVTLLRSFALLNDQKAVVKVFSEFAIVMSVEPSVDVSGATVDIGAETYAFVIDDPSKQVVVKEVGIGIWKLSIRHDLDIRDKDPSVLITFGNSHSALSDFVFSIEIGNIGPEPQPISIDLDVPIIPIPC